MTMTRDRVDDTRRASRRRLTARASPRARSTIGARANPPLLFVPPPLRGKRPIIRDVALYRITLHAHGLYESLNTKDGPPVGVDRGDVPRDGARLDTESPVGRGERRDRSRHVVVARASHRRREDAFARGVARGVAREARGFYSSRDRHERRGVRAMPARDSARTDRT